MFSRVQPNIKGNPRKRQKISHSPESEPGTEAGASTMAAPTPMPIPVTAANICDQEDCRHGQVLKRLEPDLEAMRQLITCKVCQRFLSEPYSLTCGHTYCYECLDAWLVDQKKRTCPGCRSVINQQPTPSYVIREMTLIFTSRAELLPDGETLQEHEDFAKEAAEKVARDRENKDARHGGLFRGTFNAKDGMRAMPLHDPGDGVDRCPNCHWEVEHGVCQACGLTMGDEDGGFSESYESSDSDGDSELDHELMREIEAEADDRAAFDAGSFDDDDFIDEEGNVRPHDDPRNHEIDHLFGPFPGGAAGRQVFWGGGEDSDEMDSDEDSEEMEDFIDDEAEEDGAQESNSEQEELDRARYRRLRRVAPRLVDSDEEEEVVSNASNGPRVVEIESGDEEDEDDDDEGPVALGSQRRRANRNTRRQQAAAYSSEEDESGSGSDSESGSSSDSESDSGSESDTSSSATPHAEGIHDMYTSGGVLQTGAFSPMQGDDASESGYDLHDHDHDHDHDDEDDEQDDEDDEYGGANLDPYLAGYGAYNDEDHEQAMRAETPEDERPVMPAVSHRLLKRQRRRVRHAERAAAQRARTPTRGARQGAEPDHPFQLSDTLVRINERQRRLGSG